MAKAARKSPDININLIPASEGKQDAVGEATHWLLTVGRYLIIFTEIVALVIFVLSIKLSTDKNTLKEEIQYLTSQVASQSKFEKEFRETQNRINQVKNLHNTQFQSNKMVNEFLKLLPIGISLKSLTYKDEEITFSGFFISASDLQALVSSFTTSNTLVGLNITELNSPTEQEPKYSFSATVQIVESKLQGKEAAANATNP